jgi:hypothetical protein
MGIFLKMRPKYKIEEIRKENRTSQFLLKEKVLFWWQSVEIHPDYTDRHTFVRLSTGIDYINKRGGELVSIKIKKNIKDGKRTKTK